MALNAIHISNIQSHSLFLLGGSVVARGAAEAGRMAVIGHRGKGMNLLASPDRRMREVKENSILSFNEASRFPVNFVEFDVQVTRDDCPIIFHDNFILTEDNGVLVEKRVTDLCLEEFLGYGPQKESAKVGKSLYRKTKDGVVKWSVESDAPLCTLQEAFQMVDIRLGFNVELKFDDYLVYREEELARTLGAILKVISEYGNGRPIIFSSFQPEAAQLMRKLQNDYPVFFLTDGGMHIFSDVRRNSLDEAINLCLLGGLQGIVSEVKAIFKNPAAITRIKEANLSLLTYGQLNNVAEAVYMQHLLGINGVIVDLVPEITEAVSSFSLLSDSIEEKVKDAMKPNFSQHELSFLLRLIPQLVQQ